MRKPDWDQYFLGLAFIASLRSSDPHTKHGCIIVDWRRKIVTGTGYNGPLKLLPNEVVPTTRPDKYDFFIHAEENAILNSLIRPTAEGYYKAYVTGKCCNNCFQRLLQFGVQHIVMAKRKGSQLMDEKSDQLFDFIVEKSKPSPYFDFIDFNMDWLIDGLEYFQQEILETSQCNHEWKSEMTLEKLRQIAFNK